MAVFGVAPKTARSAPVPGRSNVAKQAVIGFAKARRRLDIAVAGDGHTPPALVHPKPPLAGSLPPATLAHGISFL